MRETKPSKGHVLGWEDDGLAELVRCGDHRLPAGDVILHADEARECPVCHKHLRLVWRVYPIEVPVSPSGATHE